MYICILRERKCQCLPYRYFTKQDNNEELGYFYLSEWEVILAQKRKLQKNKTDKINSQLIIGTIAVDNINRDYLQKQLKDVFGPLFFQIKTYVRVSGNCLIHHLNCSKSLFIINQKNQNYANTCSK